MALITSRQHPLIKAFRAVARGGGDRALLDGWHLLREAVAARLVIDTVARTDRPLDPADRALLDQLTDESATRIIQVTAEVMDAASPVRTPGGVVAIVRRPETNLAQLLSGAPAMILVGVDIQDPGNTGAIVRAGEAGSATGVIFAGESADPWGWKALRAAMGSTFRLPVYQARDVASVCRDLRQRGLRLMAAVPRGGTLMHAANLAQPLGLLLGSEGLGLTAARTALVDESISIPMHDQVESLNVAVAAAVLVYEARRQRAAKSPMPVREGLRT